MQISPKFISLRKYIQALILLVVLFLPFFQFYGFVNIRGNFYSWHIFGIPFADPLIGVQVLLQGLFFGFWPIGKLIFGGLFSLILAFFLGRIFCSWICPYGFLSELVWNFYAKKENIKIKITPWKWRILLVFLALCLGIFFGVPFLNQLSAPGLISLAPQEFWRLALSGMSIVSSATSALNSPSQEVLESASLASSYSLLVFIFIPLILLLVLEFIFKKRIWCSYLCPQALLLMLSARLGRSSKNPLSSMRIDWKGVHCTCKGKSPCADACSLNINPRTLEKKEDESDACINCGACVKSCAKVNTSTQQALTLKFK